MSSTGRGVDRVDQDFYPTPAWCVHRLLEACPIRPGLLFEPFAGDGSIVAAVNDVLPFAVGSWFAADLREDARRPLVDLLGPARVEIGDSINGAPFVDIDPFDSIITNPPFSLAFESLLMAMGRARFVAFLLRLNFLGSEERSSFWRRFPPDIYVLPDRPCFHVFIKDEYQCNTCKKSVRVNEGEPPPRCRSCGLFCAFKRKDRTTSDSTEYAWFVYPDGVRERKRGNYVVLAPTPLEVRRAAIEKLIARRALAA